MYREMKAEEDSPTVKIALMNQHDDSKTKWKTNDNDQKQFWQHNDQQNNNN